MSFAISDFELIKKENQGNYIFVKSHTEAKDYQGLEYKFKNNMYLQRTAKQTPKKVGQFVSIWNRAGDGTTKAFDRSSGFDFLLVICRTKKYLGHFLFPVGVLLEHQIFSDDGSKKTGKRGFRLYPPWDKPESKQAARSQAWQIKFFKTTLTF